MKKYGFRSAAAFLRATNVDPTIFRQVADDSEWSIAKRALLHVECSLAIRDEFRQSPVWYKRFVAIYASKAPKGYVKYALTDADKRVVRPAFMGFMKTHEELLTKLEIL
jgi:hypothetical protein